MGCLSRSGHVGYVLSNASLILKHFFAFLALGWISVARVAAAEVGPPCIVFILADDLGWGDVGFNGQVYIRTPNLDQLAAEGLVFKQFYAGSTAGMPSRACLLTGRDTGTGTVRGQRPWTASGQAVDLVSRDVTIAEELKRVGYRSAFIGKWGLAEGSSGTGLPWNQGFDYFFGSLRNSEADHHYPRYLWRNHQRETYPQNNTAEAEGTYAPDAIISEALNYLDGVGAEPFFLCVAPNLPHYELTVPEDSKDPYRSEGWPMRLMERGYFRHDPDGNLSYAGMVSRLDQDVGRIVSKIQERGLSSNTLIIFSSANGPEFERTDRHFNSNGPFRGGKGDLYEGGIRVPMIAWWPGRIAPGQTDHASALWDVFPTVCDLAQIRPTARDLRGISFLPLLLGRPEKQRSHDFLYWEFNQAEGPIQALLKGSWKLLIRDGSSPELYNLDEDPSETRDRSTSDSRQMHELLSLLSQARTPSPEFPLVKYTLPVPRKP